MKPFNINVRVTYGYGLLIEQAKAPQVLQDMMMEYRHGGCFCHGIREFMEEKIGLEKGAFNTLYSLAPLNNLIYLDHGSFDQFEEYTPLIYTSPNFGRHSRNTINFVTTLELDLDQYIPPMPREKITRLKKLEEKLKEEPPLILTDAEKNEIDALNDESQYASNHIALSLEQEQEIMKQVNDVIGSCDPEFDLGRPPNYCPPKAVNFFQKMHDWYLERGVDYPVGWHYEIHFGFRWDCQICRCFTKDPNLDWWEHSNDSKHKKFNGKVCFDCDWCHCYGCLTPAKLKKHQRRYPKHRIVKYANFADNNQFGFRSQKAHLQCMKYLSNLDNQTSEDSNHNNAKE